MDMSSTNLQSLRLQVFSLMSLCLHSVNLFISILFIMFYNFKAKSQHIVRYLKRTMASKISDPPVINKQIYRHPDVCRKVIERTVIKITKGKITNIKTESVCVRVKKLILTISSTQWSAKKKEIIYARHFFWRFCLNGGKIFNLIQYFAGGPWMGYFSKLAKEIWIFTRFLFNRENEL